MLYPVRPSYGPGLALLTPALSIVAQTIQDIRQNIGQVEWTELLEPGIPPAKRWALAILFLPFEAFLTLSAITLTLTRLLITRKHMLQWTTAAHTARLFNLNSVSGIWLEMWAPLVFTAYLGITVYQVNPPALLDRRPFAGGMACLSADCLLDQPADRAHTYICATF